MVAPGGPRRRASDQHVHPENWTQLEQHRFEDRIAKEIEGVREEVESVADEVGRLNNRLTLMLGGLAILAFLLPIAAPFIRAMFGLEVAP